MKLYKPWTAAQVAALNAWQACDWVQPFFCASQDSDQTHERYRRQHQGRDERTLVATETGWRCPTCGYRQNWAPDYMFGGPPPDPFQPSPFDTRECEP